MKLTKLHPTFVAEASGVDLRNAHDAATLERIRGAMDEHAILVFRGQPFTDAEQLAFAQRLDGELHSKTGIGQLEKNRFGNEALIDISNLNHEGRVMGPSDRRRAYVLANRLWHTDASFQDPPGRYSMLHARAVPSVAADTEYADMRTAYDALPEQMKTRIADLRAHHSIVHSRRILGFDFSEGEEEKLKGAVHPLVRTLPRTGRKALYLASYMTRVLDWTVPDGRLLLMELMEHATQRQFVYRHEWRVGDLVIWDNRCTMHRATPFDDAGSHVRDLRRVTTLDIEGPSAPLREEKELASGRV